MPQAVGCSLPEETEDSVHCAGELFLIFVHKFRDRKMAHETIDHGDDIKPSR